MRAPRGYAAHEAAHWEADFRSFLANERPMVQRTSEPTPLVSLKADHGLIALFRAHRALPAPHAGGDVYTESRLALDAPRMQGRFAIKYCWSQPQPYVMTLCFLLAGPRPTALPWIRAMLRANGCWCSCAPRPDLGLLWLPAPNAPWFGV